MNIEFEQAVFKDIMNGYATALNYSQDNTIKLLYDDWIVSLTSNGSSYPTIDTITDFETKYFQFLPEFKNSVPHYGNNSDIIPSLKPEALKKIFNGLQKDDCGI